MTADGKATISFLRDRGVIATLPPDEMTRLWHQVVDRDFFRWQSSTAKEPGLTDHFAQSVGVTAKGERNYVSCIDACPEGMNDIVGILLEHTKPYDWLRGKKQLSAACSADVDCVLTSGDISGATECCPGCAWQAGNAVWKESLDHRCHLRLLALEGEAPCRATRCKPPPAHAACVDGLCVVR